MFIVNERGRLALRQGGDVYRNAWSGVCLAIGTLPS